MYLDKLLEFLLKKTSVYIPLYHKQLMVLYNPDGANYHVLLMIVVMVLPIVSKNKEKIYKSSLFIH